MKYFKWIAIERLPVYVVMAQAMLYVWIMLNPEGRSYIGLDPVAIFEFGEYWRLLTFLFIVPFQNPLFTALYLYFQYVCGSALEEEWGSHAYTVFYLLGGIGAVAAALLVGHDMGSSLYLNESIFLAFAAINPNFQVLFFFIIPLKIKWLALLVWAHIVFGMLVAPLLYKLAILISLTHYFLFFSKQHFTDTRDFVQRMRHKAKYKDQF